ncbi:protein NDR1-like [Tripterygium wilfordii]|uniref:Protein NDR1-like n=1 Tax=Tripterygium wilfordii TaxID=458696 RepID=A0A7J7C2J7_TRIWF|nr:protein NDR1-like [Tripterygium wilfordii]KAF5728374.1 protein NDR1-like [Tripterygium wilfordii]
MRGASGGGPCCCKFILTSGLTALFLWLSLSHSNPQCSIREFYIPALNKTLNSTKNTTLYFELKLSNPNKEKGIYYDPLNLTFFDSTNRSHALGRTIVYGFYQGHQKKALKSGNIDFGEAVFRAVSSNGSAVFRVDMVTKVRFKLMIWFKTKRKTIWVGADVQVNDQGSKVNPKDVKLKSMAPVIEGKLRILVNLFALILLNL